MHLARSLALVPALALAACSSAPTSSSVASSQAALAAPPAAPALQAEVRAAARFDEQALADAAQGRDPFRAEPPASLPPLPDVRPRKSRHFSVDQLRLVGLATGTAEPRAVLVDPRGKGWVVTAGDLVGRPEAVGAERVASWRVDRIRGGEVVLVRDDLGGPAATKVLALAHEALLSADD
jgi:type IV pilus assembly protein PilP